MLNSSLENLFRIKDAKSVYFYSIIVGLLSGLAAIIFSYFLSYAEHITYDLLIGLPRPHSAGEFDFKSDYIAPFNRWLLFFSPVLGGLLVGILVHFFCKEAEGTGTESMIEAFHLNEGRIKLKVPFLKAIATIITLSSGGSAGKEGPTAQIGAGIGSSVANLVKAGARARRTLMLAGTAGGLGAIFRAPLGGAITAVEVVYKEDIESDALIPCIISSVTAYLVFTHLTGFNTVFHIKKVSFTDGYTLLFYLLLGLLNFIAGNYYISIFNYLRIFFEKLPVHPIIRPAIGGAFVGTIGLFFPQVIGTGLGFFQEIFNGNLPVQSNLSLYSIYSTACLFLLLAILKMIATSFTITSGGSGGIFAPSLFIGGMIGAFVGCIAQAIFPKWGISISSFILVGMGSFFAGVSNAPMAGIFMICDMADSYSLLLPLMVVTIVALTLSKGRSIYRGQADNRFHSPAHYWDMNWDILDTMNINDSFKQYLQHSIVPKQTLLSNLETRILDLQSNTFIVTNDDYTYYGIITISRTCLTEEQQCIRNILKLEEISNRDVPAINPSNTLGDALRIISKHDVGKVAVVEGKTQKVLGYIRSSDILRLYHQKVRRAYEKDINCDNLPSGRVKKSVQNLKN
ncbi:MAG: chloride channel protein [Desulfobacterales bacterium]|nr:chloride channel protein [Desulfobacterales bacterium]MBF0398035.1 chloride channel protein [Desulfobacterales bacterium]